MKGAFQQSNISFGFAQSKLSCCRSYFLAFALVSQSFILSEMNIPFHIFISLLPVSLFDFMASLSAPSPSAPSSHSVTQSKS